MNYIGSKFSLLDFLQDSIKSVNLNLENITFCDMFAGTCSVAKAFKKQVKQVIANDLEFYSFVLAQNYIVNHTKMPKIKEIFNELNDENLTPIKQGKIYKYYAKGGGSNRQYFSDENAMKIDAIREKIQNYKNNNKINNAQYFHLLASLLESADKVANTACVYGAFLKKIKKSATKKMFLSPAEFELNKNSHTAYNDKYMFLSYNNEGVILFEVIAKIMQKYGHYEIFSTDYKRFKADNKREYKADNMV